MIIRNIICCLLRDRLTALQESGLYEVFANHVQHRRLRTNGEYQLITSTNRFITLENY